MLKKIASRLFLAVFIYITVGGILFSVHDYAQFRYQLNEFRRGDKIALDRPWLNLFYFINEAGSGMKFFMTGNERYMAHYPSLSHIFASRLARAINGDWQMQIAVGKMYFRGRGTDLDQQEGVRWLRHAHKVAPPAYHANISALIAQAEATLEIENAGDELYGASARQKNN